MFWCLDRWWRDYLALDLLYLAGIVTLLIAAGVRQGKNLCTAKTVGLAWMLIVAAFFWRFACVLSGDWRDHESVKIIALTRCVLHTLVVPAAFTGILVIWCAFRERLAGRSSRWRFGMWLTAAALLLLLCAWLVYSAIWPRAVYWCEAPFP